MAKTARYDFLKAQHANVLQNALATDKTATSWLGFDPAKAPADAETIADRVFDAFSKIDPSAGAKQKPYRYLGWLLQTYFNQYKAGNPIQAEDFYKITEHLSVFDSHKPRLPVKDRDIQTYDLDALTKQSRDLQGIEAVSGRELQRRAKRDIYDQTTVLYRGQEGMIVMPLSQKASCFWGQATEWCTAATKKGNAFFEYFSEGPLVILIPAGEDKKYQFHKNDGLFNENDKETEITPPLQPLIDAAPCGQFLKPVIQGFQRINKDKIDWHDRNQVLKAVAQNGDALQYADPALQKDPEIRAAANFENATLNDLIKTEYWNDPELVPDDLKARLFKRDIAKDWSAIQYARDCGIKLSDKEKDQILARALAEDPDTPPHIFPAFQGTEYFGIQTLQDAMTLKSKSVTLAYRKQQGDQSFVNALN